MQHAFDIAREALKSSPYVPDSLLEGEKFVLLPETGSKRAADGGVVDHDVPIFSGKTVPSWPQAHHCILGPQGSALFADRDRNNADGRGQYGSTASSLPDPPIDFEGRELDMHRVITTIMARRLVSIVGDEGVGKSALAAASCRYIADRGVLEHGVTFLNAHALSSHRQFLSELEAALRRGAVAASAASARDEASEAELEGRLCASLAPLKHLLVIDNLDLLLDDALAASDFKFFLGELLSRAKQLKVLITASVTLGMRNLSMMGVIEHCVSLGPLSLRSSLRLFAKLSPPLITAADKAAFVDALLPLKQMHVTVDSRELSLVGAELLGLFGRGHPARVVKLACESSDESVASLRVAAAAVLAKQSVRLVAQAQAQTQII